MNELQEYTKNDFLNTTAPFEYVYQYADNKFELLGVLEQVSNMANDVGVKNFKTRFKAYCDLQRQKNSVGTYTANVTNFDGQELELDSGEWQCDDYAITTYNAFGSEIVACVHPILPVLRLVNIDTGIEKLKLAYKKGRGWRSVIADKKTLASANSIIELANSGVAVNSENARYLVKYLHDVENLNYEKIPEKNSVSRLGWIDGEGFSPYVEDLVFDGDANFKNFFESVDECGNFETWIDMAIKVRAGGIYGRLVLAASFSSVLVKPLSCLPYFVHLWGGTEVGKTVGLMLAASVWANPETGRFIHTFNSTAVGREKSVAFVNSLPLILDELQICSDKRFDNDVYMLAEGAGRTRGTKTGGIDKTPTWTNCIITSGEQPITSASSGGGAVNRIIEVECKDKLFNEPKAVADTVRKNYGHAGKLFVEALQNEGAMDYAKELFEDYMAEFESINTTDKQAISISIVLTADKLITDLLFRDGRNLKVEEVAEFLHSKESVSVNQRAYDFLCEYVVSNKNKFCCSSDFSDVWGAIDDDYFYIIRTHFNRICEENGYNSQSLLSWLKRSQKIITKEKGFTKSKRINGEPINCVWLVKPDEDEPESGLPFENV